MMYLSKNLKKITDKVESWLRYEMESFEDDNVRRQEGKIEFLSMGAGAERKQEFIPLETFEHTESIGEKTEKVLNNIQEKVSHLEQEAYEKGYVQGEKDGFELGEKKVIKVIENIEKLFNEINNLKYDILKQYEREVLKLIFAVAEKIVHHEARIDEITIKDAIFNALDLAVEKSMVTFNINSEDYVDSCYLRPIHFKGWVFFRD